MSHHIQMEVEGLDKNVELDERLNARATWRFFTLSDSDTRLLDKYHMTPERVRLPTRRQLTSCAFWSGR